MRLGRGEWGRRPVGGHVLGSVHYGSIIKPVFLNTLLNVVVITWLFMVFCVSSRSKHEGRCGDVATGEESTVYGNTVWSLLDLASTFKDQACFRAKHPIRPTTPPPTNVHLPEHGEGGVQNVCTRIHMRRGKCCKLGTRTATRERASIQAAFSTG